MKTFNKSMIEVFDEWEICGINVGEAVRKQIIPTKLPEVEVEDGTDEDGRTLIYTKPYCPECQSVSYSGKYCKNCGRRLRR